MKDFFCFNLPHPFKFITAKCIYIFHGGTFIKVCQQDVSK